MRNIVSGGRVNRSNTMSTGIRLVAMAIVAGVALAATSPSLIPPPPVAPAGPIVDTYHGVSVPDPYRWLEKSDDPQVKQWSHAENERARHYLDGLPFRQAMFDRLMKQAAATSSSYSSLHVVGDRIFARYDQPPRQQQMVALLGRDLDPAHARVIVDPNSLDPKGSTAVDWFVPSPDGKLLAVSMSKNGSEDGSVHIFDVASAKESVEIVPRVQFPTAGGSLAWRADSKGFWYTRYPGPDRPASEQHFYQQVYFHNLGDDPTRDAYVLGKDFPKIAEIALDGRQNTKYVVASVANGDGGQFAHYIIDQTGRVTQIDRFEDGIVGATMGPDDALYLVSRKDAPRGEILKLTLDDLSLAQAHVFVPQSDAVVQSANEFGGDPITVTKRAIYVREIVGGPSRVAIFDSTGKPQGSLPLPDPATVSEVDSIGDDAIVYSVASYLRPPYFARYVRSTRSATETKLAQTSPVSFGDVEVVRELATSKDGTRVPLNILRRKGTRLNGANPVLLYGYGGYSAVEAPRFVGPGVRLWLDGGGVYAIANLRGGGEFGEEWHAAGALTHKQNVFDDFVACARYLIAQRYTTPAHLAILGGSNGGLLMGATVTQHPELFRAVASLVGIYDMLRVELDPNGAFNTTEFGSTADPTQFKALLAYSPYHHVIRGVQYPAIFMATGENDGRVNPMHSRKMIAKLQAANASDRPILLTIESRAGHGIGSALSVRIGQYTDVYSFLFDQLGMPYPAGSR
jgi:prolyl oligopeptidase